MSRAIVYWTQPLDFQPHIDVVGCIVQSNNEILLLKRNFDKPQGGTWCLPAGKVESTDSSIVLAMQRELAEETGIMADVGQIAFYKTAYVEYPDLRFRYHQFSVQRNNRPTVHLDKSHSEWQWVTPAHALELELIPGEDECIKMFFSI
jgi:8-oxo-dGTP pyrophosphatase MutT (NUDIX family)